MIFHNQAPDDFNLDILKPPRLGNGPWPVSAIALDVSGRCNLACRYCAETATQPRRCGMSEVTLIAAWNFLQHDCHLRPGYSIRLGSGEPLLGMPILRRLTDLIAQNQVSESKYPPDVFLTTNGTLIDPEILDWLVASKWHVKVSLDGPKVIQDRWRVTPEGKGTYSTVTTAITNLTKKIPERLSVTAVLCQGADPKMIFSHLQSMCIRRIEFVPAVHQNPNVVPDDKDIEHYESFLIEYVHKLLDTRSAQSLPELVRFENILRRVMGYDLKRVPCGAGRSFIGIGSDGDLYPCFRFIGINRYRIGNVTSGMTPEALSTFQTDPGRPYEQRRTCRKCWAAPLCGGPCFANAEMFGSGNGEPYSLQCAYTLIDAWWAVWLVKQLRQHSPEQLITFLPGFTRAYLQE